MGISWEIVILGLGTVIIATALLGCLESNPSQEGSRGDGAARGRAANRQAGEPPQKVTMPQAHRVLSARAQAVQKELNMPAGSAVSVVSNDAVLVWTKKGTVSVSREGLEALKVLCELADVFLITEVETDAQQSQALEALRVSGIIQIPSGPRVHGVGIVEHKCLFCSTSVGKQAIVRQLRPQLHIDREQQVVANLVPHVPRLALVHPAFPDRRDSVPYRVLPSLQALLGSQE